jgi:hypothetical protein
MKQGIRVTKPLHIKNPLWYTGPDSDDDLTLTKVTARIVVPSRSALRLPAQELEPEGGPWEMEGKSLVYCAFPLIILPAASRARTRPGGLGETQAATQTPAAGGAP